jgi:hypothetical protein
VPPGSVMAGSGSVEELQEVTQVLGLSLVHGGAGRRRMLRRHGVAVAVALAVGAGVLGAVNTGLLSPASAATAVTQSSGMLNPVLPQRLLDTRTTTGGHHAVLGSAATMKLTVLGMGGVPGAGVSAVLLNVTAANEIGHGGFLTLYQTGITRPAASTLDYRGGVTVANQALVRVGADGTISIFNSAGQVNVIVDVEGWVGTDAAAASGQTTTATPVRLLDTRSTTGGHQGALSLGQSVTMPVEGAGPVPATGVAAVWADVVAVPVGNVAGFLTAYPSDASSVPVSSTVSFLAGVVTSNLALVPVSADGSITITNRSPGANVILDVVGWVSGGDATADAGTQALPATRILDTRTTLGGHHAPVPAGGAINLSVLGVGGVPSTGVAGVIVHVTGVSPSPTGTNLTALGTGFPRPVSTILNLAAHATVSNTTVVPVGSAGAITIYNPGASLNLVIDVQGWIAAPVLTVTPPAAAALGAGALTATDGKRSLAILTNANRYAMTTWWNTVYPHLIVAPMTSAAMPSIDDVTQLTFSAQTVVTTDSVRRLVMEAYSLATSIATGAYNPAAAPAGTGVTNAVATSRTIEIITKVVAGHITVKQHGWGATSQSSFLAAYLGTAAWLLWPQLTAALQAEVARMVYFEAEWGMERPLQFYANKAGTVLQPGDTGADQDSWYPMADQLAVAMMPGDTHVSLWQNTIVRDAVAAWSRPSDDTSATVVNGASVASWIGNRGSNVLAGGNLYNHHRYAPDYSTLIYQNMQDILVSALAGQAAPKAVTALVKPVYASYASTRYAAPPNASPGGTVYRSGSPAIYYPQGCDWGTGQQIPYALVDAETAAFGVGTSTSAAYEGLHADRQLAMQRAHADGHTYDTDAQYVYVGREEHTAQLAAQLYLTKYVRDHHLFSLSTASYWLAA